ncbi:PPE family protein [[Mycobacterium] nativiensis]|uniref:PPE family protein n=1 Tax=[Mycobacterium] nativiensis TaxID=2855503 RepID=A0ABU5XS53_9MYCO|nr:PPE family protein [Mycolicibacter sp. MYC340]MEB3030775.1 PPE family protein [Mycolicibacter sp. MYC340]
MVFGSFAAQPPEIISGQMYSGPGADPLFAAAAAWSGLATELHATASSYAAVLAGLSGGWQGPAAAAMATAANPYVNWLSTTAAQVEQTAAQATAAGSAYESAFAGIVPPPAIAANRSQLASLVASNIFGQNSTEIAAVEAEYLRMWSQDVAAMLGYAGASASAANLTAFTAAPQTTSGDAGSAESTAAAATTPPDLLQQVLNQINSLANGYTSMWQNGLDTLLGGPEMRTLFETDLSAVSGIASQSGWVNGVHATTNMGITHFRAGYKAPVVDIPKSALGGGLSGSGLSLGGGMGGGLRAAGASTGSAVRVGALSVPPNWASATSAIQLAATSLPDTAIAASPAAGALPGALAPAALGSAAGGALGAPGARTRTIAPAARVLSTNLNDRQAPVPLDQVIAQLQQTPDVVQHWNVDQAGLDELVAKLSLKPGIHAVHVLEDEDSALAGANSALA